MMMRMTADTFRSNRVPPRRRPTTPAEEQLLVGRVSRRPLFFVSFVDTDEEGTPRLIQYVPDSPRIVA
jgi:hypothetical protein